MSQLYYIQDKRQYVGNCVLWWCPDNAGYTCNLDNAGLYTEDKIRNLRDTDIPWPQDVVEASTVRHVDIQRLRKVRDRMEQSDAKT